MYAMTVKFRGLRLLALALASIAAGLPAYGAEEPVRPIRFTESVSNWDDQRDRDFVSRGFIATREESLISNPDGTLAIDLEANAFIDKLEPRYVHPGLLRQAKLLRHHGLFEVVDGVYQVRGFDITNITFIRGESGWIVIDPALVPAAAKAAYELVSEQLGELPIRAVIYTHSHLDHFGGAAGLVTEAQIAGGAVSIIAPEGFVDAALREFLVNGEATRRRTGFAGIALEQGEYASVGVGLSNGAARGPMSFIPPTLTVSPGESTLTMDGVELVFQLTPGTEAPAEMNIYLPRFRVLHMAENANNTMHNVLSPRGVEVRDAKAWADYLSESIDLFGDKIDAVIIAHGWPRFGQAEAVDYLSKHRDAYKYLHDQTVRMMNKGLLPDEIGNRIRLPASLEREWYNHGYYGSLSFNSRAVYQRYLGWYDANPVNLAPYEPLEESTRYVKAMGGRDSVMQQAQVAIRSEDFRWASELLNRVVMSDSGDQEARNLLADCYQQMAYWQENGMWRNMYLSAAKELREGIPSAQMQSLGGASLLKVIPTETLFEMLAVRLNPEASEGQGASIRFELVDTGEVFDASVHNDVLTFRKSRPDAQECDASVSLAKMQLAAAVFSGRLPGGMDIEGDAELPGLFFSWFEKPKGNFPVLWRQ